MAPWVFGMDLAVEFDSSTGICPAILARPKNNLPSWELLPRTAAGGDFASNG